MGQRPHFRGDGASINPVSVLCRLVNRALTCGYDDVSVLVVSFSARSGRRFTCAQTGGGDGDGNSYDHSYRTNRDRTTVRFITANGPAVPAKGFCADGGFLLDIYPRLHAQLHISAFSR